MTIHPDQMWADTNRGASAALAYRPALDQGQGRSHSGTVGFCIREGIPARSPFFSIVPQVTGRALGVRSFSRLSHRPAMLASVRPLPLSPIRSAALLGRCDRRQSDLPRVGRHNWRARFRSCARLFILKPSNHFICQGADCSEDHRLNLRGSYASTRRALGGQNLGNPCQIKE